jgi:hypothetical protein
MNKHDIQLNKNHGGPLHYLGNRFLSLPDVSGHMCPDNTWLNEHFSIILFNNGGKKYKRCIEPLSGSASWSLAVMEVGLADEYIINDSDKILTDNFQVKNIKEITTRAIDWKLIAEEYDEMIKHAVALKMGTATADTIIRKFARSNYQHPTFKAFMELGV